MPHMPGKFCLDQNMVRWSLLEGVITRKANHEPPTGGRDLPARQVTAIEQTMVTKVHRLRFGWSLMGLGVVILAVAWWIDWLPARLIVGLLGLVCLYVGSRRIRPIVTVHDAYQLVIDGMRPAEWIVVGSTPEALGFLEAVQAESAAARGKVEA